MSEDVQHEISCSQRYGAIVRAAGIDSERLESLTLFELAGHIKNDEAVHPLLWAALPDNHTINTKWTYEDWNRLLIRVLSEMDPASRRAMALRVVGKLNEKEVILSSRS